ncbi:MAG: putative toxin-antitoxin system toxin component, PIN family [Clostridia bacterium]|nr:putative toxin-antitoxin system toxin component, PIN family [Clostridia bacterium]
MMLVVLDTNVLVSAMLSPHGNPKKILAMVASGYLRVCYDSRIFAEYREVLFRRKFPFIKADVTSVLEIISEYGISVAVPPLSIFFTNESDRKFYEVAAFCGAKLITGNIKHFPQEPNVMTPTEFIAKII